MVPSRMKSLSEYPNAKKLKVLFTDIDGTLTVDGLLPAESYQALWDLTKKNIRVVPVTGRPAGWCEMIARLWPVAGVVGENGAFYFSYTNRIMHRAFETTPDQQILNREKLNQIYVEIKKRFPRAQPASDQFSRLCDLAVDFCEDVEPPMTLQDAAQIAKIFADHGATAKVSSIHVNGWIGNYDKLKMCLKFARERLGLDLSQAQEEIAFVGDSPNDEPMFEYFKHSFAVANIKVFANQLKHQPTYVSIATEGLGFSEISKEIVSDRE